MRLLAFEYCPLKSGHQTRLNPYSTGNEVVGYFYISYSCRWDNRLNPYSTGNEVVGFKIRFIFS